MQSLNEVMKQTGEVTVDGNRLRDLQKRLVLLC